MNNTVDIMNKGIECLIKHLGTVDTEQFISTIMREKFDYTKWQREQFENINSNQFNEKAVDYSQKNPFKV